MHNHKSGLVIKVAQLLCVLIAISLTSCGKDEGKKTSTQVAAKVDGAEISLHQINQVLQSAKNVTPDNVGKAKQEILEKLIDQQIVVEKALKDNLDRTPEVMLAIEAAKKDILARAYISKLVSSSVKISDQEIKQYYEEHPGLFSKRRVYNLQDIGFEKNDQVLSEVKEEIAKQKTIQEIADSLKSKGIKISGGTYTRPAEQIPLEALPSLQDLKEGQTTVFEIGNAAHVIRLVKAQDAPVDLQTATPLIKNYFMNVKGKELIGEEMKRIRQQAKIEYVGEFQAGAKDQPKENTVAKPSVSPDIEKGVSGL